MDKQDIVDIYCALEGIYDALYALSHDSDMDIFPYLHKVSEVIYKLGNKYDI